MWPIEARCAAIANNYFVVGINRVGTVSLEIIVNRREDYFPQYLTVIVF